MTYQTKHIGRALEALKDATIMMVDDEPITMDIVQVSLEEAGYTRFIQVERSVEALQVLRNELPDILLLDLRMPEVTGFDILTEVRADDRLARIPVIVLTSATDSDTKLKVLELGATDFLSKPVDASELILRLRNTLAAKAYQDQLAYYDTLTQLPNRRMFTENLVWSLRLAKREERLCALLHIGIDRFKEINSALGPQVGDELLRAMAERLRHALRDSDTVANLATGDLDREISRLGGDEYAVLLQKIGDPSEAGSAAQRIMRELGKPYLLKDGEQFVSLSMGIAVYPHDGTEPEDLLKNATSATSFIKKKGGGDYQFYSSEINARSAEKLGLQNDLHRALEREQLEVYYQAKLDIVSGRPKGTEALLRWNHHEMGIVGPIEFIPIAEKAGLIIPIGAYVMNRACEQTRKWQLAGLDDICISVNVAVPQLRDPAFITIVRNALETSGLAPHQLIIELTESMLMDDAEQNNRLLSEIKEMGVQLSMDDFGTGYSSLSYLKKFPLDELKIDRSFVKHIVDDPEDTAIVSATLALAHSLGLSVVAEGVEDLPILRALQQQGCDLWQGYHWGKPLPAEEATRRLLADEYGAYSAEQRVDSE